VGSILDKINMGKLIPDGHQDDHYFGVQEKNFIYQLNIKMAVLNLWEPNNRQDNSAIETALFI